MKETNEVKLSLEKSIPTAEELLSLIAEKRIHDFREAAGKIPPPDIAELMYSVPREERITLYRFLSKDIAAEVFVEMGADIQEELIGAFSDKELSETLSELYLDDTVDIIEEMPAVVVKRIIRNSTDENRAAINMLLRYPEDSAGTIMTTEYVKLSADVTVSAALDHIRKVAIDKETIYTCYITDSKGHLKGLVTARALMLSSPDTVLSEIIEENVIFARTTDDKESVAKIFNKYGFIALPVVDNECRLVGIVTVDDAMAVMSDEVEEDFAKMAAITPQSEEYLKTSPFSLFRSRIPWLLLLMVSATVTSTILSFFEAALIPALVLFIPMLMDTGGNSGSQASVTAIRALSLGEIEPRDAYRVLWKELRVGFFCGLVLGVVSFLKVMLVDNLLMGNPSVTASVSAAVSFSLAATVIAAKSIGCTLPLLAKRIGFDPAVMASPFITTLVDAIGLLLYFFISRNIFALTVG